MTHETKHFIYFYLGKSNGSAKELFCLGKYVILIYMYSVCGGGGDKYNDTDHDNEATPQAVRATLKHASMSIHVKQFKVKAH